MSLFQFKENFFGGTRSNRFLVQGNIPLGNGAKFSQFHVRATILPQMTTKTLSYDYFGRKLHYPGEKDYGSWAFTVLDDTGPVNNLWAMFQRWQNEINNHETNRSYNGNYKGYDWLIKHLDMNGLQTLKEFRLQGCWPASIQQMSLNMLQPNSFNSFNVVVIYDYVEITNVSGRL